MNSRVMLAVVAAALSLGTSAQAVSYFTDLSSFNAAAGSLAGSEDFEVAQSGATHTYAGFTFSEINGSVNNAVNHNSITMPGANPVVNGGGAAWFDDNDDSVARFVFNSAITAFGIYVTTDSASTISVSGSGISTSFSSMSTPGFFGVIADTAFTMLDFAASGGPNIGFDAAIYGIAETPAVPLPATGLLLAGGLAAFGLKRRKR